VAPSGKQKRTWNCSTSCRPQPRRIVMPRSRWNDSNQGSCCGSLLAAAPARQGAEVPLIHVPGDLGLATAHLAQSSSASRFTAGACEFFISSQSGERPERERESFHFECARGPKSNFSGPKKCRQRDCVGRPVACRLSPFLRFELLNECSEVRGNGSRQRVVLVLQASANLADCEESTFLLRMGLNFLSDGWFLSQ
jgi:hypothetical protein